jgi:hypothetical protein
MKRLACGLLDQAGCWINGELYSFAAVSHIQRSPVDRMFVLAGCCHGRGRAPR